MTARAVASGVAILLVGVLGVMAQERSRPVSGATSVPPLCRSGHANRGRGHRIDLGRVEANYRDLSLTLARDIKRSESKLSGTLERSYDAGIKACVARADRTIRFESPLPGQLKGRKLAFVRSSDRLPGEVLRDPKAAIFVVKTARLGDLSRLADRWGRPVSLADGGFAKALGITCVPAWIEIAASGREGRVHEIP